jgi:primosomal protein N' (replication factor Y)
MYANIIIDITHEKLDKIFQYKIPEELEKELEIGTEVIVPFGRGNRETAGYVIGFSESTSYDPDKIKSVLKKAEKRQIIESKLVSLAAWIKVPSPPSTRTHSTFSGISAAFVNL